MRKHSLIHSDLFGAVLFIIGGGLLVVAMFLGLGVYKAQATEFEATYRIGEQACSGDVVVGVYYEGEVHVDCDVHRGQRLDVRLPRGMSLRNMRYLSDQFGGRLVLRGTIVDADF